MHSIEEVGRYDVGRDGREQRGWIVVYRVHNTVIKVVISQGFDRRFIENQPRKTSVVELHVGSGGISYGVGRVAAQEENEVEIDSAVVGGNVEVVHEWQQYVLVGHVKGDPCGCGEVDCELHVNVGSAGAEGLREGRGTEKKLVMLKAGVKELSMARYVSFSVLR